MGRSRTHRYKRSIHRRTSGARRLFPSRSSRQARSAVVLPSTTFARKRNYYHRHSTYRPRSGDSTDPFLGSSYHPLSRHSETTPKSVSGVQQHFADSAQVDSERVQKLETPPSAGEINDLLAYDTSGELPKELYETADMMTSYLKAVAKNQQPTIPHAADVFREQLSTLQQLQFDKEMKQVEEAYKHQQDRRQKYYILREQEWKNQKARAEYEGKTVPEWNELEEKKKLGLDIGSRVQKMDKELQLTIQRRLDELDEVKKTLPTYSRAQVELSSILKKARLQSDAFNPEGLKVAADVLENKYLKGWDTKQGQVAPAEWLGMTRAVVGLRQAAYETEKMHDLLISVHEPDRKTDPVGYSEWITKGIKKVYNTVPTSAMLATGVQAAGMMYAGSDLPTALGTSVLGGTLGALTTKMSDKTSYGLAVQGATTMVNPAIAGRLVAAVLPTMGTVAKEVAKTTVKAVGNTAAVAAGETMVQHPIGQKALEYGLESANIISNLPGVQTVASYIQPWLPWGAPVTS